MIEFEKIRLAYTDGCERGSLSFRACVEWYLEEESPPMEEAEDRAARAYRAARAGNLDAALAQARCACQFERQEYGDCPIWRPLHKAIETALRDERASTTPNDERNCCHA